MSDKKSCQNCKHGHRALCYLDPVFPINSQVNPCDNWQRSPSMWLSILPTEPGWYWFQWEDEDMRYQIILSIRNDGNGMVALTPSGTKHLEAMLGQWQGPITPKGDK